MNQKKLDFLPNSTLSLYQDDEMFKINTDTSLLGSFINFKVNKRVLDIGCNNGALLLYCLKYKPSFMLGIDIDPKACEIARMNMELNNVQNVMIINKNIKDYNDEQFDVIISNPPYDQNKRYIRNNDQEAKARFTIDLTLDDLISQVNRLLKDNGRFFMIHRATYLNDIIFCIRKHKMSAERVEFIYQKKDSFAQKIMIVVVKRNNTECKVYHRIIGV